MSLPRSPVRWRRPFGWLIISVPLVILAILFGASPAQAAPADPFTGASSSFDEPSPEATSLNLGDWGVAEQRATSTYTFPIAVPPGRNGMAPDLALRYSSGSGLRGGLAVGWRLDVPSVMSDRSRGVESTSTYQASLRGASGRLVEVPDLAPFGGHTYRVEFDDSFTRFSQQPNWGGSWLALTADGARHYFGNTLPGGDHRSRWPITEQVDAHGNTIRYFWSPVASGSFRDYSLDRIEYSSNDTAALTAHAKVEFSYAPVDLCAGSSMPIGAAPLAGNPLSIEGSRRLRAVTTSVRDRPGAAWRVARRVELEYELRSSVLHQPVPAPDPLPNGRYCTQAPLRYLTKIQGRAFDRAGHVTSPPPITFKYNDRTNAVQLPTPTQAKLVQVPGFGDYGTRLGAVGHLLDIDGDGIRDQVSVREKDSVCTLIWQRGLPGGVFDQTVQNSPLPTTAWHQPRHYGEGCSFNGQVAYRDQPGDLPSTRGIVSYHFLDYTGDGRVDLLTNVWAEDDHDSYQPSEIHPAGGAAITPVENQVRSRTVKRGDTLWKISQAELGDPNLYPVIAQASRTIKQPDGRYLTDPDVIEPGWTLNIPAATLAAPPPPGNTALTPEGSPFLWRVYRNAGDPEAWGSNQPSMAFSAKSFTVIPPPSGGEDCGPKPLPPTTADNMLDQDPNIIPPLGIPTLTDIDGDGFLDLVDAGKGTRVLRIDGSWCVYFGRGGADFVNTPYRWPVPTVNALPHSPAGYDYEIIDELGKHHSKATTRAALIDMNGDGRADLTIQELDGRLKTYLNTGTGFRLQPLDFGVNSPLEVIQTDHSYSSTEVVTDGARGYRLRLVDVDGDGLPDLLTLPADDRDVTKVQTPSVRFNTGDRFLPSVELPRDWVRAQRLFRFEHGVWHLVNDFFDATGDGLDDLASWSTDGRTLTVSQSPGLPNATDLLHSVDNGRGGETSFGYGLTTDAATAVGQHVRDVHNLPTPIRVISEISVAGGFGTPRKVTQYTYDSPQYVSATAYSGVPEHHRFVGFGRITADVLADGAAPLRRTVHGYGYDQLSGAPDGRLVNESVYERQGDHWRPHMFTANTWTWEPLFGGRTFFVHRGTSLTRTCQPDASEATCTAQTMDVRRSAETWEGVTPSGVPSVALYVPRVAEEGAGVTAGQLDRRTRFTYQVRYGQAPFAAQDYRILETDAVREAARRDIAEVQFEPRGHTRTTYDNANGLPVATDAWADASTVATTRRTFDPATGNLTSLTKAAQAAVGGSGKRTTYTYDPYALFARTTTNELGHYVTTIHDVATGALLDRKGPNSVVLRNRTRVWERETWQIDGLGRTVAHAVSFDDPTQGYVLHTVDKTSYFDSELPNRIRAEHLRDLNDPVWITRDRKLDGLGRQLADIQVLDAGRAAAMSYRYDGDGKVAAVETPDPRVDDGTQVRNVYAYDGLGRLTRVTLPNSSGVKITYDGLSRTIRETAPDASGATKRQVYDVFGRLVKVDELYLGQQTAHTGYGYDSNDNLASITDADGIVSSLAHDWLDRRVTITRGEQVWRYSYDLNGNLAAQVSPVPAGTDPVQHTVDYTYDDLDRVTSLRFADPGNMDSTGTPERQAVTYTYDQNRNGLGRLSSVALGFGKIRYAYDPRGLITTETRSFTLNDIARINVTQQVQRTYNAAGQLTQSRWNDGQRWRLGYDTRGLVQKAEWYDPTAGKWQKVADYDRSLAGPPRVRHTSYAQSRQYSYDALGRIVGDAITAPGHDTPVATRSYTINGSGDLATVDGTTNGLSATATYKYDTQHRLTRATGPNGYTGAFTYTRGGNLHTASVTWNGSTQTRDVRYDYHAPNPQAVDSLVDNNTNVVHAQFTYDSTGNTVERATPTGNMTLKWDGLNRLRRAHTDNGDEIYLYDHTGARILAVSQTAVRSWFAERETHYTLDGTPTRRYLHLSDGASALARVENGTKIELDYADSLQNLMVALDSQGNVAASFLYGPYGEMLRGTGETDHRRQFNGKEGDASTGLRYYGARYFDPLVLRWNSADPLYAVTPDLGSNQPQRLNLYTFSLNNPNRYYDPDGKAGEEAKTPDNPDATCTAEDEAATCTPDDEAAAEPSSAEETQASSENTNANQRADAGNSQPYPDSNAGQAPTRSESAHLNPPHILLIERDLPGVFRPPSAVDIQNKINETSAGPPNPNASNRNPTDRRQEEEAMRVGLFPGAVMYGIQRERGYSHEAAQVYGSLVNIGISFGGLRATEDMSGHGDPVDVNAPSEPPRPQGASAWGVGLPPFRK